MKATWSDDHIDDKLDCHQAPLTVSVLDYLIWIWFICKTNSFNYTFMQCIFLGWDAYKIHIKKKKNDLLKIENSDLLLNQLILISLSF